MAPKVLMVAEKPSIALSIASVLLVMSTRRGSTDVHEFEGIFRGAHEQFKVTSVIGHVFSVDFPHAYQSWEGTDPIDLFEAPVIKSECNLKLYKELICPLDGFELLLFSMVGPDAKSFPFCPFCYNSPSFEGIDNLLASLTIKPNTNPKKGIISGMPCFLCPHPTCRHSMITQGVCACPECMGTHCNSCNCLVLVPQGAHMISTTGKRCDTCDLTIIEVDFNKNNTPLGGGKTLYQGCILCYELLHSLVEVKHGKSFSVRGREREKATGRGRGRGRGRGGGKNVDAKMSFRDF